MAGAALRAVDPEDHDALAPGYCALAAAMLEQAAADARQGDALAVVWLLDAGYSLAEALGASMPFEQWREWTLTCYRRRRRRYTPARGA